MDINDELERKSFRLNSKTEQQILQMYNEDIIKLEEAKKIVSRVDADVIVKLADVIEECAKIAEGYEPDEKLSYITYASRDIRALKSKFSE